MNAARNPVLVGISLSETFIPALETAAELLRDKNPGMCDAELLNRILVAGICSVIQTHQPHDDAPFGQIGQQIVAVLR